MTQLVDSDAEAWHRWLYATYDIYAQVASHVAIHETAYWQHVRNLMQRHDVPPEVRDAVALLTALSRRDADELLPLVEASLLREANPLPLPLRTIAGVVALEGKGAAASDRKAFAQRWMAELGNDGTSEDLAYQVVRAYASRDD